MSLQSFMNIVLAETEEEKERARREHIEQTSLELTDDERIALFLADCTDEKGRPLNPADFGIKVTFH